MTVLRLYVSTTNIYIYIMPEYGEGVRWEYRKTENTYTRCPSVVITNDYPVGD